MRPHHVLGVHLHGVVAQLVLGDHLPGVGVGQRGERGERLSGRGQLVTNWYLVAIWLRGLGMGPGGNRRGAHGAAGNAQCSVSQEHCFLGSAGAL